MRVCRFAVALLVLSLTASCYTTPSGRQPGRWALMYPVNRALDLADIVSVGAGPVVGLSADVHATRALQIGAGGGAGVQAGWWPGRYAGLMAGGVTGVHFGPFSYADVHFGEGGAEAAEIREYKLRGSNCPGYPVFQEDLDYWAVGAKVIAGVVGLEFDIHPTQIADALLGFLFIDIMQDDIGNQPAAEPAQ
jgi:hypothetical protein